MRNVFKLILCDLVQNCCWAGRSATIMSSPWRDNQFARESSTMAKLGDVREEEGDLFRAPRSTSLAHCVSSDLKMGAGIAVLFRNKFGQVEELKQQKKSTGEVAYLKDGPRFIFYLITKKMFYDKPTELTLHSSLLEMKDMCLKFGVKKLAMPRIGCGLDGLRWPSVFQMVKETFSDCGMEVTIYNIPDKKPRFMTPNLTRTQEKFRSFFDQKRPHSLPLSAMTSKRKLHSDFSEEDYATPKKRMRTSSNDYEKDYLQSHEDAHSVNLSSRKSMDSYKNTRRKYESPVASPSWNSPRAGVYNYDRSSTSPWMHKASPAKQINSSHHSEGFLTPLSHTVKNSNEIPFLSDEDDEQSKVNSESRRGTLSASSISDYVTRNGKFSQKSNFSSRFSLSKHGEEKNSVASEEEEDLYSKTERPPIYGKSRLFSRHGSTKLSAEDKEYNVIQDKREKTFGMERSQSSYSIGSRRSVKTEENTDSIHADQYAHNHGLDDQSASSESSGEEENDQPHRKSCNISAQRVTPNKSNKSSEFQQTSHGYANNDARRSRSASRTLNKSRDKSRSYDRQSDSSESQERKSRRSSKSKERKSQDSRKSKERRSRHSSKSKERKSQDSSKSKERKSRDSSKSKERKSRDTSKSKERKRRSTESKHRPSRKSKERSPDSSASIEKESPNSSMSRGNRPSWLDPSKERKVRHPSESSSSSRETYDPRTMDETESRNASKRKTQYDSDYSDDSTERSFHSPGRKMKASSRRLKGRLEASVNQTSPQSEEDTLIKKKNKQHSKYPTLSIHKDVKMTSKPTAIGTMYCDREKPHSSVKSRLALGKDT